MNIIGKLVLVQDVKKEPRAMVGGRVIDKIAGTEQPKRVRLTTGEHAGEVRCLGQYRLEAVFA